MIKIDFENHTYICPFCGHAQAYRNTHNYVENGANANRTPISPQYIESSFRIYTLYCQNSSCMKICVTAINRTSGQQIDILPQVVFRQYPEYIPEQIRRDYMEACMIIDASPKAAATLLRRCLQGMIRDFWNIQKGTLNEEINAIKDKVTPTQWKALDSLRKIGNIGAHMEKDVNLMIDIEPGEANKLLQLIELLFDKWYITRHDEDTLLGEITAISDKKENQRKT